MNTHVNIMKQLKILFFLMGLSISIMGFGLRCDSSLILVPKPPAKITVFILNLLCFSFHLYIFYPTQSFSLLVYTVSILDLVDQEWYWE